VSAGVLSGFEFGPGALTPYRQFSTASTIAVIDDAVFVFEGHFEIPLASRWVTRNMQWFFLTEKQSNEALAEAQTAVALAPDSVMTQSALGDALMGVKPAEEARVVYKRALELPGRSSRNFK